MSHLKRYYPESPDYPTYLLVQWAELLRMYLARELPLDCNGLCYYLKINTEAETEEDSYLSYEFFSANFGTPDEIARQPGECTPWRDKLAREAIELLELELTTNRNIPEAIK